MGEEQAGWKLSEYGTCQSYMVFKYYFSRKDLQACEGNNYVLGRLCYKVSNVAPVRTRL